MNTIIETVRFADHTIKSDLDISKKKFSNPGEAIAELGDNSKGANATEIHFSINSDGKLSVCDNGFGMPMNKQAISEMLTFGASEKLQSRNRANSIGQHGYGLKAAIFYFASMEHPTEFTIMSVPAGEMTGWMASGTIDPSKKRMENLPIIPITVDDFKEYTGRDFSNGFYVEMTNIDEVNYKPGPKRIEYNSACNYILASSYVRWIMANDGRISIQMPSDYLPTVYDKEHLPVNCDVMYRDSKSPKISHIEKEYEYPIHGIKETVNFHFTKFTGMNRSDYTSKADMLYYDHNKKFGISIVVGGISLYDTNLVDAGNNFMNTFKGSRRVSTCDTIRVQLTFGPELSKVFLKATSNNKRETKFDAKSLTKEELNVFSQIVGEINDVCTKNRRSYGAAQCAAPYTIFQIEDGKSIIKLDWIAVKSKDDNNIIKLVENDEKLLLAVNIAHPYFADMKMNSKSTEIDKIIRKWMYGSAKDLFIRLATCEYKNLRNMMVDTINSMYGNLAEDYSICESLVESYQKQYA